MATYIDVSRRFRDLTKEELEEPELLASFNEYNYGSPADWQELLCHPRVLLLAEAGSGKTAEMREQVRRLTAEKKHAFFVPLESIDRDNLSDLLTPMEERDFAAWKADDNSPAWFFLDAVDELKLNQGTLERALKRFSKAVDGFLDRTHVVISCRPTDWRPVFDLATFRARLPILSTQINSLPTPDEFFIAPLRKAESVPVSDDNSLKVDDVRTVVLLPMSERQIESFAEGLGVTDTATFMAEINKQDAWTFARRPLDCSELVATWKAHSQLGTRIQQHETNIVVKLRDDPERADRDVLTDARARDGAERLALALALTCTRTMRTPEQSLEVDRAVGVLDPKEVLPDWNENERQSLLRKALFDPATYGRVRFHHRSVQEYLAACRLKNLRDKGMSTKALLRLFFAERYGERVVVPSMSAIAAWLALWNDDVRRELLAREPEALLSMGDPQTLPMSARVALVKAFAEAYGKGDWRGFNIPLDEVRRLAHPDLADVIRATWGDGPSNEDVRGLLLRLIWQGAIKGCADIAQRAAMNTFYSPSHRTAAIRAVIACENNPKVREIAESIIGEPDRWPDRVVHDVAGDLFPRFLSAGELIVLVEMTRERSNTISRFEWALREIAMTVDPCSEEAGQLRDKLVDLIWRGRYEEQEWYQIGSRFSYTVTALLLLCDRQLSINQETRGRELLRACVIASRFDSNSSRAPEEIGNLRRHFKDSSALRETAFWLDLALMDELNQSDDDQHRLYQTEHNSVVGNITEGDRAWLEAALVDTVNPQRKPVAMHALIGLWAQRGRKRAELEFLRGLVRGNESLTNNLSNVAAAFAPSAQLRKMERDNRRRRAVHDGRVKQRLLEWTKWREELLSDPAEAFGPGRLPRTIDNLYKWLAAREHGRNRYNVWNLDALMQAFSSDVAQRAAVAFQTLWRTKLPQLWSSRAVEDRNRTPWDWVYGLCGLAAEAMSSGWATKLNPAEARTAAAFATVEVNGFPAWLEDLVAAHPSEVDAVLGVELISQLAMGAEHQHIPMLQDLTYAKSSLKQLLAPRLLAALKAWPSEFANAEAGQRSAHHLNQVLRVLHETSEGNDKIAIASECEARFSADRSGLLALVWLRALFRFDAKRGALELESGFRGTADRSQSERAIEIVAALFSGREAVPLDFPDPSTCAAVLGRLVRCVYKFVRHEGDQEHEVVYELNTRDKAENARNQLLSILMETPGADTHRILTHRILLELATEPDFSHFPDRLRILARQRAANDSESVAYSPSDLVALDTRLEAPPHDRDGLFSIMRDRLDDLSHDVAHDDFTDRHTLQSIKEEREMQLTLARRLKEMSKGAYVVTREDEVADRKQTDIRLASVRSDQRAVIEVKIADTRWSLNDLEYSLRNQLVGQYLRHENCRAGCLLLTYDGTKNYWEHPETGARLGFRETVDYLGTVAQKIEQDETYGVRLAIHGLDLTDPVLAPAHR